MERRGVIRIGAGLTAGGAIIVGTAAASAENQPPAQAEQDTLNARELAGRIKDIYEAESERAGGTWQAEITVLDGDDPPIPAVDADSGSVQTAASMNKLAIALGVLDKVDRGEAALDDRITLDQDIILGGSGLYFHQAAFGDELTVANILVALLLVSDNTAVRLCGLVCPPAEINQTLEAKGFTDTRVIPSEDNPDRMWLGDTTAHELNDLLHRLALGELLSETGTGAMLGILRGLSGYHDGFRRNMSSAQRSRIAMKYGADGPDRNEAGVVYTADGAPAVVYAFTTQTEGHEDDYGATHPAVEAKAAMGRQIIDALDRTELAAPPAAGIDLQDPDGQ